MRKLILTTGFILSLYLLPGLQAKAQDGVDIRQWTDSLELRNSVGMKAADFAIITAEGKKTSLYQTKSELTLVFLYHPDCYTCIATIQYIKSDEALASLLEQGRLTILAVDLTEDMISLTEGLLPPKGWTLCFNYDARIVNEQTYFIKEFPSLYLLDREKTVLLKEPQAHELLEFLQKYTKDSDNR